jgi:hypothetical protein
VNKHKNFIQNSSERLTFVAGQVGILLMSAACVTGMLELPSHPDNKVIVPMQPNIALANELNELNSPIRREREDPAPQHDSYSVSQRTHSVAASK